MARYLPLNKRQREILELKLARAAEMERRAAAGTALPYEAKSARAAADAYAEKIEQNHTHH